MKQNFVIPARAILNFVARIGREELLLHGFELRYAGRVQAEGYYAPFQRSEMHRMYSASKSMVSLAVGLLEADGKLRLSDPIAQYFPEYVTPATDKRLLRLTICDMLRMATGHIEATYVQGRDEDWASTFFAVPPTHEPGTVFAYDSSGSHVLGALCRKLAGEGLLAFLERRVFQPIGAADPKDWLTDPSGVPLGGSGLRMSLRDFGKTAQLLLDGGGGIVPKDYIDQATAKQIETPFQPTREQQFGYGYQFWRTRDGYAMYGMGAQMALVCTAKQMILCTVGDTLLEPYALQQLHGAFYEELYEAEPVREDSEADRQALADVLAALRIRPLPHNDAYTNAFAARYGMADNPVRLREVRFADGEIRFVWPDGVHVFPYTLGEVRDGTLPQWDTRCLVSAGFNADRILRLRCHLTGDTPCGVDILLAGKGDTLTLQMRNAGLLQTRRYDGVLRGEAARG